MPLWLSVLLEIVKITLPALIVFVTVHQVLKQFLDNQYRQRNLEYKRESKKASLPLRLQAYERLSLFCERISIPQLLLRMRKEGMSAKELRLNLMLTIQQEYEHNLTQQIYVSGQLWEIIKMARDDSINTISLASEVYESSANGQDFSKVLLGILEKRESTGPQKALEAIKKEAAILL
ncbi:MAG: hypothetical protein R3350_03945 [Saprospiraceae bacterium]|nr:hypothetical protein [Saprospiraceae bacterium]